MVLTVFYAREAAGSHRCVCNVASGVYVYVVSKVWWASECDFPVSLHRLYCVKNKDAAAFKKSRDPKDWK